eukprot:COSAG02_NODE_153_length_33128_cov_10.471253_15_plen_63_part_00
MLAAWCWEAGVLRCCVWEGLECSGCAHVAAPAKGRGEAPGLCRSRGRLLAAATRCECEWRSL